MAKDKKEFFKNKLISIDELKPYDENSRLHSQDQILEIRNSIKRFGFTNPIQVDAEKVMVGKKLFYEIIAGHGRLEAAILEGYTELPSVLITGLSEDDKRALVITDNQLALNATYDEKILKNQVEQLLVNKYDITVLGLNDKRLAALLADTETIEVPEIPFSEELNEQHNYIVMYCDNNVDWLNVESLLGDLLTTKADNQSKGNYKKQGVGRVLKAVDVIEKIQGGL